MGKKGRLKSCNSQKVTLSSGGDVGTTEEQRSRCRDFEDALSRNGIALENLFDELTEKYKAVVKEKEMLLKQLADIRISYDQVLKERDALQKENLSNKDIIGDLMKERAELIKEKDVLIEEKEVLKKHSQDLQEKVHKLEGMVKGKEKLDEVLAMGKSYKDQSGIGYQFSTTPSETKFVSGGFLEQKSPPRRNHKVVVAKPTEVVKKVVETSGRQPVRKIYKERYVQKFQQHKDCSYCKLPGHKADQCFRIVKDLMNGRPVVWPTEELRKRVKLRRVWVAKKSECNCLGKNGIENVQRMSSEQRADYLAKSLDREKIGKQRGNLGLCHSP